LASTLLVTQEAQYQGTHQLGAAPLPAACFCGHTNLSTKIVEGHRLTAKVDASRLWQIKDEDDK